MASHYRAIRNLRKNGLRKALGLADDAEITKDHLKKASESKNEHVMTMADLYRRAKSKKSEKAKPGDEKDSGE